MAEALHGVLAVIVDVDFRLAGFGLAAWVWARGDGGHSNRDLADVQQKVLPRLLRRVGPFNGAATGPEVRSPDVAPARGGIPVDCSTVGVGPYAG